VDPRIAPSLLDPWKGAGDFPSHRHPGPPQYRVKASRQPTGRSSDSRINLIPAPSHPSQKGQWPECRFRPRSQRRDRTGFTPASLLSPGGRLYAQRSFLLDHLLDNLSRPKQPRIAWAVKKSLTLISGFRHTRYIQVLPRSLIGNSMQIGDGPAAVIGDEHRSSH
jgi:hypothetical protein